MTQEKKKREKPAHQLILAMIEKTSAIDDNNLIAASVKTAVNNRLLAILEEMKIQEKDFAEIANELERFNSELKLDDGQKARITTLIAEFRQ